MSGDTLSDLLRAVRLRGAVFFYVEGVEPWVAETPESGQIIPAILPGVDHMENEAAFARAFRRAVGESPAAWRRSRRAENARPRS